MHLFETYSTKYVDICVEKGVRESLSHGEDGGDHLRYVISQWHVQVIMVQKLVGLEKNEWICVEQEGKGKRIRVYSWRKVIGNPFRTSFKHLGCNISSS